MKGSKGFWAFLKSKWLAVKAFFTSLSRKWLIAILIGAATVLVTAAALLIILLLPGDEDGCAAHIDTDGDLLCDVCGAELKEALAECVTHINRDADDLCDRCGKPIKTVDPDPEPEPEPTPEHRDADFDGKCDICLETMGDAVLLVQNGKSNFSFVYGQGLDGNAMMTLDMLAASIKRLGVTVPVYADGEYAENEYEILVGGVFSRGDEYDVDPHKFGVKGYTVSVIGNKIVVLGGSNAALIEALGILKRDFFGITDGVTSLTERAVYSSQSVSFKQNDYKVTGVTLLGEDMQGYTIAIDKKNTASSSAALRIQTLFYEKCGYWFPIVDLADAGRSIVIKEVEKTEGDGLYATFGVGRITFEVEYTTSIKNDVYKFFSDKIDSSIGTIAFDSGDSFTKDVYCVYYKDFGAVGDGVTNDAEAILQAHRYAFEGGHRKIAAEPGKTYYIGDFVGDIPILCDVDWTGASFIIDDTAISIGGNERNKSVFLIDSLFKAKSILPADSAVLTAINEKGGFKASEMTCLDLGLGYPAMLRVYNSGHKNYIRYGSNANSGASQLELILVDAEGNIDPRAPFLFDYDKVSSVYASRIEDEPITVRGGRFTTIANRSSSTANSYFRGISINRSNVTLLGVEHYVIGEGEKGGPYNAFFQVENAYNVLIEDCVVSAHKEYYNSGGVGVGSYDIGSRYSINVTWKDCNQANFYNDDGSYNSDVWGVMGSSYSKNLTFDGCLLNRFDAHAGVYNATIKDTKIKHIRIVGGGTLLIEGCDIYNTVVVSLREDYGGFWYGEVVIKDTTVHANTDISLFSNTWYNHDFGYQTALPEKVTIDGLKVNGLASRVRLYSQSYAKSFEKIILDEVDKKVSGEMIKVPNVNKTLPTKEVVIKNKPQNAVFDLCTEYEFLGDMTVTEEG